MSYETIVTTAGRQALSTAISNSQALPINSFKVGDGNGSIVTPTASATDVVNACYTGTPARLSVPDSAANQVAIECVVPASSGGYTVREIGIYSNNTLICYAATPEIEKPLLGNGAVGDLVLTVTMTISSANAVTLAVDPGVAVATRQYVDRHIAAMDALLDQLRVAGWAAVDIFDISNTIHSSAAIFDVVCGERAMFVKIAVNSNGTWYFNCEQIYNGAGRRDIFSSISHPLMLKKANNIVIVSSRSGANNSLVRFYTNLGSDEEAPTPMGMLYLSYISGYGSASDVAFGLEHYVFVGTNGMILDYAPINCNTPWIYTNSSKRLFNVSDTDEFTSVAYSPKLNKFCAIGYKKETSSGIVYNRHCVTFAPGATSVGEHHSIATLSVSNELSDESVGKIVWSERDECFVVAYQNEKNVFYSRDGETWHSFSPGNYLITNITADTGVIVWYYNYVYFIELPKILDGATVPYVRRGLSIGSNLNNSIIRSTEYFDGARWWRGGGNKLIISAGGSSTN